MTARLAASKAGCAFSVSISSPSGPSNISRERCVDSASSTSSNSRRAAGNASASARPMPGVCEPCPGNTNARFMSNGSSAARYLASIMQVIIAPAFLSSGCPEPSCRASFAEAQIVALVFVILQHLQEDAVLRQRLARLLDLFQGRVVVDDRLQIGRA